jgi:type II secretory pathway component GspD/PulD (secretin)
MKTLGSLTGLGPEGAWSFGAAAIIPDKRLNRMFVYGAERDLAKVQRHLEVIDRENSIADVQTHGTPRVIELRHANAEQVAAVIRDVYAGRIGATAEERRQTAQQLLRQQANPQGRGEQVPPQPILPVVAADSSESARMTLAVDARANSLIVTAPSQLADEVQRLAMRIDEQSVQAVRVIGLKRTGAASVRDTLGKLLGDRVQTFSPGLAAQAK